MTSIRVAAKPASLPTIRHRLNRLLDSLQPPPQRAGDIRLAVTEACANGAIHAYPGRERGDVSVTADASADLLVVTVRDYGHGIQPGTPSADPGIGLPLLRALADTVTIIDADPGVEVRMTFRLYRRTLDRAIGRHHVGAD